MKFRSGLHRPDKSTLPSAVRGVGADLAFAPFCFALTGAASPPWPGEGIGIISNALSAPPTKRKAANGAPIIRLCIEDLLGRLRAKFTTLSGPIHEAPRSSLGHAPRSRMPAC